MVKPSRAAFRPLSACPSKPVGPHAAPRRPRSSASSSKLRPSPASPGSSVSAAPRRAGQQRRGTRRPTLPPSVTSWSLGRKTIGLQQQNTRASWWVLQERRGGGVASSCCRCWCAAGTRLDPEATQRTGSAAPGGA